MDLAVDYFNQLEGPYHDNYDSSESDSYYYEADYFNDGVGSGDATSYGHSNSAAGLNNGYSYNSRHDSVYPDDNYGYYHQEPCMA